MSNSGTSGGLDEISIGRDQHAADAGTCLILGTALFDSGRMPSRLALLKAVMERARASGSEDRTRRYLEGLLQARLAEQRQRELEASGERVREQPLRDLNATWRIRQAAQERALAAQRILATAGSIAEQIARQDAVRRERQTALLREFQLHQR
jgi:hypothetical protein